VNFSISCAPMSEEAHLLQTGDYVVLSNAEQAEDGTQYSRVRVLIFHRTLLG
jgi:hypothetical protein